MAYRPLSATRTHAAPPELDDPSMALPTSPDRDVAAADLFLRGHGAAPIAREPTAAFGPLNGDTQGLYAGAIIRQGQLHDIVSFNTRFRAVGINLDRVRLARELGLARRPQGDTQDRD